MLHPITSYLPGQDETPGPNDLDETFILDVADELSICDGCNGSGEGMHDGTRCSSCRGSGSRRGADAEERAYTERMEQAYQRDPRNWDR